MVIISVIFSSEHCGRALYSPSNQVMSGAAVALPDSSQSFPACHGSGQEEENSEVALLSPAYSTALFHNAVSDIWHLHRQ